ncbi:MAG TPA: galactonate dehydratase [Chloroflexota bacterium]|nr:galactonate dehydratase [Chloroflexota bacterium]
MKITTIETFPVDVNGRNLIFLKVNTDEGITGVGEAYSVGPDLATVETIRYFADWLAGEDPGNVEHLWARLYNQSRFPGGSIVNSAISGIEHALWDIKGKALGVPVYQLLGGKCRDRILAYHGCGGPTPEALAENAAARIEAGGYGAVKISPFNPGFERMSWGATLRIAAARLAAVREAVGDDIDIGVDPHATTFEPIRAIELAAALAPYRPSFVEEPLRPENIDALARVVAKVTVPIATGENLYTKYEFRELLVKQAADIIQPDICIAGGILELKKIAAMAEAFYVPVAPHNPMGPVATAVNVQFAASTPNFLILEYIADDRPPRRDLVKEPIRLKDGYLELPTAPGLGIELNEDAFPRFPYRTWHRVSPIRPDGSIAFN